MDRFQQYNRAWTEYVDSLRRFKTTSRGLYHTDSTAFLGPANIARANRHLRGLEYGKALDLGCGEGNAARKIKRIHPHIDVHALDIHPVDIEGVEFHEGDIHSLPFGDGTFDFVFSMMTFDYCIDKLRALKEAYRVLREGGFALIQIDAMYMNPHGDVLFPDVKNPDADFSWATEKKWGFAMRKRGKWPVEGLTLERSLAKGCNDQVISTYRKNGGMPVSPDFRLEIDFFPMSKRLEPIMEKLGLEVIVAEKEPAGCPE